MSIKGRLRSHPRVFTLLKRVRNVIGLAAAAVRHSRMLLGTIIYPWFIRDALRYRILGGTWHFRDLYPQLHDRTSVTPVDSHYTYQRIWATKLILDSGVRYHCDVGSDAGFVTTLTAFTKVQFVDIRPLPIAVENLVCTPGTILELPFADRQLRSLSCMHVVEHIGLGRYGDPLDPQGSIAAAAELQRVLGPGGSLYLSVPVGRPRTMFNAHRVFSPSEVASLFPDLKLVSLAVTDDSAGFHQGTRAELWETLKYGCGMYHFQRGR